MRVFSGLMENAGNSKGPWAFLKKKKSKFSLVRRIKRKTQATFPGSQR